MTRTVPAPDPADLDAAAAVVGERLAPTPLVPAPALGERVWLKLETLQPTGSFKVRGALAALAGAGGGPVVTASAGNAGLGIAWAAAALGVPATIVVPESASPAKVAALRALPVELRMHGASYDDAEEHALALPGTYVSAYNDTHVIAGAATIGRELEALDDPVTVVCAVGGGGLASGLGLWAAGRPGARVLGVEAEASPAFSTALAAGRITPIDVRATLADGLAGNIEPGAVTFPLVRDHVEGVVPVTEAAIADGIRFLARAHGLAAEGAAAVPVAGLLTGAVEPGEGTTVVVVSGRNIALDRLAAVLAD